jgi:predicted MFS family arabinose efflux permease
MVSRGTLTNMKERPLVLLVAAVQFVNILDFMMIMPLGPDFASALGIATSHIGVLGGAYTLAAAVSGIVGARILDRFDRRTALGLAMLGLIVGTAAGGFSVGLWTLLAARLFAGAFGGPATAVALAIVGDAVPPARRGKAIGTVMAAFSLASIIGVPSGLEAARYFGWRAPFFGVAGLGLVLLLVALRLMPSMRGHLVTGSKAPPAGPIPFDALTRTTLANTACTMIGVFAVVPNISAFLQHNLGMPRDQLGPLYFAGGVVSLIANRAVGGLVDRFGATPMVAAGTLTFAASIYLGFLDPVSVGHLVWVFCLMMVSGTIRGVPMQTLATRVPPPSQRARFMSAQNAVQHLSSAAGAFLASLLLTADPSGRLHGMTYVGLAAIAISLVVPVLSGVVERGVRRREAEAVPS